LQAQGTLRFYNCGKRLKFCQALLQLHFQPEADQQADQRKEAHENKQRKLQYRSAAAVRGKSPACTPAEAVTDGAIRIHLIGVDTLRSRDVLPLARIVKTVDNLSKRI